MTDPRKLLCAALVGLAALAWLPAANAGDAPIRLTVRLPADATLTIDGHRTRQTGPERLFESPPVAAGKKFNYTLVATWTEGGAPKSAERKITVEAGGVYTVDFLKGANGKKGPDPKKEPDPKKDPDPKKEPDPKKDDKKSAEIEVSQIFGALMRRDGKGWDHLHDGEAIPTGSTLVALPAAKIHAGRGAVLVGLLADVGKQSSVPVLESAVTFREPGKGFDAELTYERGIIELANLKKQGAARVRLHVGKHAWEVTLQEPGSRAVFVLYGRHLPGTNLPLPGGMKKGDVKDSPLLDVRAVVTRGQVLINTGDATHGLQAPPGPALFHWDSESGSHGTQHLKELPPGADGPDKAALAFGQAICERTCKFCEQPADKVIAQLLAGKEFIDRGLGVVAAGALDDLPRVLDSLNDAKHADTRDVAVKVLRAWIGRGPGQVQKLHDALVARKYPAALARTVVQGLVGFSEEQAAQPALYELLIGLLDHKELAVRELARWHLVRLAPAGAEIPYDAGAAPDARAAAVRQWRELIPEGQLPRGNRPPVKN